MKKFILSTAITILSFCLSISAQVPNNLNYQGYLTDAVGNPIADGMHSITFTIYDAAVGGTNLWSSGVQGVTTVDGLFSYQLGSNVALPNGIFADSNRFLGITVGGDPEISPRSKFNSTAFAFTAERLSGDLLIYDNLDTLRAAGSGNAGGFTTYGVDGLFRSYLYSFLWGQLILVDNTGFYTVDLGANTSTGGYLSLADPGGPNDIYLSAAGTGNSTMVLPENAIDNTEILDEPGIAVNISASNVFLDTSMSDLAVVTITIPSDGYIHLTARCWASATGNSVTTYGIYQIDETAGGSYIPPYYTVAGCENALNSSFDVVDAVYVNRVYFKSAGTYTFRFEGMRFISSSSILTGNHNLTASYYPTAYGTVDAISPNAPEGLESEVITVSDPLGNQTQINKYDLRQLELEAKDAALKAKEAELRLLKAQQAEQRKMIDQNR